MHSRKEVFQFEEELQGLGGCDSLQEGNYFVVANSLNDLGEVVGGGLVASFWSFGSADLLRHRLDLKTQKYEARVLTRAEIYGEPKNHGAEEGLTVSPPMFY